MARVVGQIDLSKNEAILDAAVEVMAERGWGAPLEEIARRACVSKQTIYNHYGSKAELARAMTARRAHGLEEVFEAPGVFENPAEALAGYARLLLRSLQNTRSMAIYRMAMQAANAMPDVARAIYEAGPKASRARLAEFLRLATVAGRIDTPDPLEAAEFFGGMVINPFQGRLLLGVPVNLTHAEIDRIAHEAATRFMRAYAPQSREGP